MGRKHNQQYSTENMSISVIYSKFKIDTDHEIYGNFGSGRVTDINLVIIPGHLFFKYLLFSNMVICG